LLHRDRAQATTLQHNNNNNKDSSRGITKSLWCERKVEMDPVCVYLVPTLCCKEREFVPLDRALSHTPYVFSLRRAFSYTTTQALNVAPMEEMGAIFRTFTSNDLDNPL
jgi:hypothetical protein